MNYIKRFTAKLICILYRINTEILRVVLRKIVSKIEGGQMKSLTLRHLLKKHHNLDIGIGTYGACFNLNLNWAKGGLEIGKYCSFASNVSIYSRNHPYDFISTHPYFYNEKMGYVLNDQEKYHSLKIGNDVWVGQNVVILPSCSHIGDGVVIGAGSIVTHNIPDYAIVVGAPAKILKYRFSNDDIKFIKESKWWDLSEETIRKNVECFINIDEFKINKENGLL